MYREEKLPLINSTNIHLVLWQPNFWLISLQTSLPFEGREEGKITIIFQHKFSTAFQIFNPFKGIRYPKMNVILKISDGRGTTDINTVKSQYFHISIK